MFAQRERFSRLIAGGVSNSEACRLVGINRRTGTRWRFGRTILDAAGRAVQYPPVTNAKRLSKPLSRRYLSRDERTVIADLLRGGGTIRVIAAELGRDPATIGREVRRNLDELGRYLPHTAQRVARARLERPRELERRRALRCRLAALDEALECRAGRKRVAHAVPRSAAAPALRGEHLPGDLRDRDAAHAASQDGAAQPTTLPPAARLADHPARSPV